MYYSNEGEDDEENEDQEITLQDINSSQNNIKPKGESHRKTLEDKFDKIYLCTFLLIFINFFTIFTTLNIAQKKTDIRTSEFQRRPKGLESLNAKKLGKSVTSRKFNELVVRHRVNRSTMFLQSIIKERKNRFRNTQRSFCLKQKLFNEPMISDIEKSLEPNSPEKDTTKPENLNLLYFRITVTIEA